jgi:hypothetical protein
MGKKSLEKVVASLEKTKTDEDQKAISEKKRGFTMQQKKNKSQTSLDWDSRRD